MKEKQKLSADAFEYLLKLWADSRGVEIINVKEVKDGRELKLRRVS